MDVQLPDGTIIAGVPDGMSKADLLAKLHKNGHDISGLVSKEKIGKEGFSDTLKQELADNPIGAKLAAFGTAASDLWQGGKQLVGMGNRDDIANNNTIKEANPGSALLGNVAMYAAGGAAAPALNTLKGATLAGGVTGALMPTENDNVALGKLENAGMGAGLGFAGTKLGSAVGSLVGNARQAKQVLQSQNLPRDTTLKAAQDAGYVVPRSLYNPTFASNRLESLGGKAAIKQQAAMQNQQTTNNLARKYLGLPEDMPLSTDALQAIRNEHYSAGYEPVKKFGFIRADQQYTKDLDALIEQFKGASNSFPDAIPNDVEKLVKNFKVNSFDSGDAIDATRVLREKAGESFAKGDKSLGKACRGVSDAIEKQIERGLSSPQIDDFALSQAIPSSPDLSTMPKESIDRFIPQLQEMAKNAGWSEVGGRIVRDAKTGEVVRRTKWVARDPSWFKAGMGENEVKQAVKKLSAGDKLTKKEQGLVDQMTEFLKDSEARASIKGSIPEDEATAYIAGGAKSPDVPLEGYTPEQWKMIKSGEAKKMLDTFREARKGIAKTYTIEKALNNSNGDVSALSIGAQLKKNNAISDEARLIGNFAKTFPQVSQNGAKIPAPGVSKVEAMMAALLGGGGGLAGTMMGGAATGGAGALLGAGLTALPHAARPLALSKLLQSTPKYGVGPTKALAEALLASRYSPMAITGATLPSLAQ